MHKRTFAIGVLALLVLTPMTGLALSQAAPVSGTTVYSSLDGPSVTLIGSTNVSFNNTFPDNYTVDLRTLDGNATFTSGQYSNLSLTTSNITGTHTTIQNINATGTSLEVNPEDKSAINASGTFSDIRWGKTISANDGKTDFQYDTSQSTSSITVRGLDPNTGYVVVDATTQVTLATTSSTATGKATFGDLASGDHTVLIQTSSSRPSISNPSPTGNLSSAPSQLAITVNDTKFPGDTVSVSFTYDGTQIKTTSISSNQRVTASLPGVTPGIHHWSVTLTDNAGHTVTGSYQFGVPGKLYVRNETNTSQLVKSPVTVNIQTFTGSNVTKYSTSSGVINLTGFPTSDFILTLHPDKRYRDRTIRIESIIGNQSVYLLSNNITATQDRFVLNDPTGQYGPTTILKISKPITQNNKTSYKTIASDEFGTEGLTEYLQKNQRYRLVISNQHGLTQDVGVYRATANETVTVKPGAPGVPTGNNSTSSWLANATLSNRTLLVQYQDLKQSTSSLKIWIYEHGNKSNQLRPNQTYRSLGNLSAIYSLTKNESQKTWTVAYVVTRNNKQYIVRRTVSNRPGVLPASLSPFWKAALGIGIIIFIGGAFTVANVGIGAIITPLIGGLLWYVGLLEGATTAAGITMALFFGIVFNVLRSRT